MRTQTVGMVGEERESLKALKQRRDHLADRMKALQAEVESAKSLEAGIASSIEKAQVGLVEGTGDRWAVMKAAGDLQAAKSAVAVIETALARVKAETTDVESRIEEMESESERTRQEKGAKPLQEAAEACVRDFLDGLARVRGPLERRKGLALELRDKFPRVSDVPRVRLDVLAAEVVRAFGGNHQSARQWLETVLAGPGEVLRDGRLEDLHIQR